MQSPLVPSRAQPVDVPVALPKLASCARLQGLPRTAATPSQSGAPSRPAPLWNSYHRHENSVVSIVEARWCPLREQRKESSGEHGRPPRP